MPVDERSKLLKEPDGSMIDKITVKRSVISQEIKLSQASRASAARPGQPGLAVVM